MTTTFPAAEHSSLSPVLIRLNGLDNVVAAATTAWNAASGSVPTTSLQIGVRQGRQTVNVQHTRQMMTAAGSGTRELVARLCDRRPGETPSDGWPRFRWQVTAHVVPPGGYQELLEGYSSAVRLDVRDFRVSNGRVDSAAELALFRHLFARGLQVLASSSDTLGGQAGWDDDWWRGADEATVTA
jgi:hypothetical protein